MRRKHPARKYFRKLNENKFLLFVTLFLIADTILLTIYLVHRQTQTAAKTYSNNNCATARGPFTEKGSVILQADGKQFIPYGTTIEGLSGADYRQKVSFVSAQIKASADSWCSNTVRFQVAQHTLVGPSGREYLNTMKSLISQAEADHLVVVICAQTEVLGLQPGPTAETVQFWNEITKIYGRDPQVVYDLFNEPRVGNKNTLSNSQVWQIWQHGGVYRGQTYVGMQELVDDVRNGGAKNLLWVEGPWASSTFGGIRTHQITNASPMMYAMHHPRGKHQPANWNQNFGYLVNENIAPVVVGEWSNWASAHHECWPDAPTAVPRFLSYLQSEHIGLTVWTLQKNVMTESDTLSDPSHIKTDWQCKDGLDEGAGSLVMNWYKQNNSE